MGMFGDDKKDENTGTAAPSEPLAKSIPPRVETIQGRVKTLTSESPGKVKATIVLNGDAGEIHVNGQRFRIGESVRVSISAEE